MKRFPLILAILYIILIFIGASIPGDRLYIPSGTDYILHILEFVLLGFLISWAVFLRYEGFYPYPVLWFGIAVGIITEIYQYAVPLRTPSLMDVMADAIGVFLGIWMFAIIFEREWMDGIRNKIL